MALANGKWKGKGLSITIDSVEYNMDFKTIVLNNEDADDSDQSFADLNAGGGKQWFFEGEAFSDYGAGSVWSYIWDSAGTDSVAFTFKPYGNATATTAQPHFTGTLSVGAKPGGIGATAGETSTFEIRFDVDGTPTRVTA